MEEDHGSGSITGHRPGVSHAGMQKADLVGKSQERDVTETEWGLGGAHP